MKRSRKQEYGSIDIMLLTISILLALSISMQVDGRRFKDGLTTKCLDNVVKPKVSKGSAHTNPCNGGSHQNWHWGKDHTIKNFATGQCLEADGKTVYTMSCHGTKTSQKWRGDGAGSIINFASKKCLKSSMKGLAFPQDCSIGRKAWLE
ncbi:Actinohivin [Folsomia candida]|uniref:Actinohivin n=1 Tax=Folsomia candida TaxID=158441 RepID=A0A226EXF7_FOLCA|nr:Actinohivin [Folsomia candida]